MGGESGGGGGSTPSGVALCGLDVADDDSEGCLAGELRCEPRPLPGEPSR